MALVVVAGVVALLLPRGSAYSTTDSFVTVRTGPDDATSVPLDTRLYLPDSASAAHPAPLVLIAHGFGGDKLSEGTQAKRLAGRGYAVLTWTAEGFGRSGGSIHLDSLDWEVKDVSRLIDAVATRPEIAKQAPNDPRVAVIGGSYGGGVSLLAAARDHRIDAIVPSITWNDLADALLPQSSDGNPADGVFKRQWAGLLFGAGSGSRLTPGTGAPTPDAKGTPACGRFAADVCAAYQQLSTRGRATPEALALLRNSSPSTVISSIKAPTLLIQGEADSLFPLSQADANARGIAANGTPVKVFWFTGGHDAGEGTKHDRALTRSLTDQWLDHYLEGRGGVPDTGFTYSRVSGIDETSQNGNASTAYELARYPGLDGQSRTTLALTGGSQAIANPPNGNPSAISSLPIGDSFSALAGALTLDVPGQHADFTSAPLASDVQVVGAPSVRIRAASPTGEAVLFLKLFDVDPSSLNGKATLPQGLIAPVRLTGLPKSLADATPVEVRLPPLSYRFGRGHRLRLTVATSDQAFSNLPTPTTYTVAVDGALTLPSVAGTPLPGTGRGWQLALAGLLALVLCGVGAAVVLARRRAVRSEHSADPALLDTPLIVRDLRKEYADGFVAAARVSFEVPRNSVVGLLGPNGAGKTTTLRVLMGLTRPSSGEVLVFGQRLEPGARVLERVGALVEGPGFMPHLTGRQNLELYWRSTGRPAHEARLEEALDIAALGDSVNRRTKSYSHGMRQRLAIAQAMLGMPELLVLDEPSDGLDPPQIASMRRVLRDYARDGRAVLVSSHLLAEVEQMCTDVVIMNRGQVVASGTVAELIGNSPTVQVEVSDGSRARAVLSRAGVPTQEPDPEPGGVEQQDPNTLVVDTTTVPASQVLATLVHGGVDVMRLVPRRRLEDAFLALVGGDTKASGDR